MSVSTVYLAIDQPIWRLGVTLILERQPGFRVVGLSVDDVEAIPMQRPVANVVVIAGFGFMIEALRRVSKRIPNAPLLVITRGDDPELGKEAIRAGAQGYLPENADVEYLIDAVTAVGQGEFFFYHDEVAQVQDELAERATLYDSLSQREREILPLLAQARSYKEIADRFLISRNTVQTYRQRIMEKLKLRTKANLLRYAIRMGILR